MQDALQLVVSPLSRGAYFADVEDVARAELRAVGVRAGALRRIGGLELLEVERADPGALARLSFVQAVLEGSADGFRVVSAEPGWALPEGLVWGAKYRGKTHELVTQLAINIALSVAERPVRVLVDPMAGRGTTLLWAARYGLDAHGIERDAKALDDLQRHVKRQTKLARIKHTAHRGFVGKKSRDGRGRFAEYRFEPARVRLVTGDSREGVALLGERCADVIVADLPYGVQFTGRSRRDPIDGVRDCAPAWAAMLRPGGSAVLIYNRLQPRRQTLLGAFADTALQVLDLQAPHRMSESIHRDLLVMKRPGGPH